MTAIFVATIGDKIVSEIAWHRTKNTSREDFVFPVAGWGAFSNLSNGSSVRGFPPLDTLTLATRADVGRTGRANEGPMATARAPTLRVRTLTPSLTPTPMDSGGLGGIRWNEIRDFPEQNERAASSGHRLKRPPSKASMDFLSLTNLRIRIFRGIMTSAWTPWTAQDAHPSRFRIDTFSWLALRSSVSRCRYRWVVVILV